MKNLAMPSAADALPGREQPIFVNAQHFVNGNPLQEPFPEHVQKVLFGLGCFWGGERKFWETKGVFTTAVGYTGGFTRNPTYEEVCSGQTGHNEVVLVVYEPDVICFSQLLTQFWEAHNPTQGMRQGNDIGTQYRSGIYYFTEEQRTLAENYRDKYQLLLTKSDHSVITTEIIKATEYYYAEDYHQQYLAKNPMGYCGMGGTGVTFD